MCIVLCTQTHQLQFLEQQLGLYQAKMMHCKIIKFYEPTSHPERYTVLCLVRPEITAGTFPEIYYNLTGNFPGSFFEGCIRTGIS